MSLPKRPTELLQLVMTVFREFEKKLDQLQEDVHFHGQALSDLKIMLSDLSDLEVRRQLPKKYHFHEEGPMNEQGKQKRKKTAQILPKKIFMKTLSGPKFSVKKSERKQQLKKAVSLPIKTLKQSPRLSKADAPRKATTLKTQKNRLGKSPKRSQDANV